MLVKITVQGEEGAVLTLTDNSTWAVPGSEEVAKPENPEGLSNPENPSPTLAELHEKIQSMGFIEKTAKDLKADHDRQFAKFKKKVHWYCTSPPAHARTHARAHVRAHVRAHCARVYARSVAITLAVHFAR